MSDFTRSHRRLTALRLSALGIARPISTDATSVVRGLLALQAQDYAGALWSIGLRLNRATLAEVEHQHETGAFVRSWPMRSTLHFVAADDLGWMLALTSDRMQRAAASRHRDLGLAAADFDVAESIARGVLAEQGTATRAELLAAFEEGGVSPAGQRGVHVLGRLAQSGVLVLTGKTRWALLEQVAPHPRRLEREEALGELAARYFASHGPATVRDLAWWAGIPLSDVRTGLAIARAGLQALEVGDTTYYHRADLEPARPAVHLLPGFDEYLLGYTDRSAPLANAHVSTIVPGNNGMFLSTMVVNGEVVGSWRRERKAKGVAVTVQPFGTLSPPAERGVGRAASRYAAFLGLPLIP